VTTLAPRRDCTHECHDCDLADPQTCADFAYMHAGDPARPRRRRRVYVAGPLNALACDYLKNVHRFVAADRALRRHGLAPFNPALDLLTGILDGEFEYADYFEPNFAWLEAAEAVYLLDHSPGADRECVRAVELGIPVFESMSDLLEWAMQPNCPRVNP
jgi:hypothetical protein